MLITWLGHSCFKIQDKTGPDGVMVVTDPFDKKIGLKPPSFEADIVTVSCDHYGHNNASALRGNPFTINSAGEYDIKGVAVQGTESFHSEKGVKSLNIIYRIEVDDISIAHLGNLSHILDNKQLEILAGTDILLVPVGGRNGIDAKKAAEIVSQIEPRIVIPMLYKVPGLVVEVDGVDKFIKEIGLKPTEEEKLKILKKDLPQEDMELVVFKI